MAKDLGFVEPDGTGRWSWPFREMELNDYFRVRPEDRSLADVRKIAHDRGYQLGRPRQYGTVMDEDGNALVTRELPSVRVKSMRPDFVPFEVFKKAMRARYIILREGELDEYGNDTHSVPWELSSEGEKIWIAAEHTKILPPAFPFVVVDVGGSRYGVEYQHGGFHFERLPPDSTIRTWQADRMLS